MRFEGLGDDWELERNAIKPYACCGLTHATIDCGRELAAKLNPKDIESARLEVNPLTLKVADQKGASTPLEGKFSVTYCAALALSGYKATEGDFHQDRIDSQDLQALAARTTPVACEDLAPSAARMQVQLRDGRTLTAHTEVSLGNPENPMSWDDMREKFLPLVQPALGKESSELFDTLRHFEEPGQMGRAAALTA